MPPILQKPVLARLAACIAGIVLFLSTGLVSGQMPPDAQPLSEAQRFLKQRQLPQALEKINAYLATQPKDPQGRFLKGVILTEMGRSADAIAVFTALTEDFPELPEPYNNLAVLYAQQKQYEKARMALEMAIRDHPGYAIAHENLGDIYVKLAARSYDKAIELDPSNKTAPKKLATINELIVASGGRAAAPSASLATRPEAPPAKAAAAEPPPAPPQAASVVPVARADRPIEKPLDAAPSKPAEPVSRDTPPAGVVENEIVRRVEGWADAWSRKDVKAYFAFYADDFQPPSGMTRATWEKERQQRIEKSGRMLVTVDNIKVTVSGNTATARFRQHYTSPSLKSSVEKTLVFVKSGENDWLIQQERTG